MQKQFVTYRIALKLKELGFDEECLGDYYIIPSDKTPNPNGEFLGLKYEDVSSYTKLVSAPLWQQVIDWIESKGYYINITRVFQWSPLPIKFSGWCIYIGTENPEEELACNSYYIDHYYSTKKEAIKQAILKAIELCQKEK